MQATAQTNMRLKIAIVAARTTQRRVAADSGITENRFSEIVCGWISPSDEEKRRIAAALGSQQEALFG